MRTLPPPSGIPDSELNSLRIRDLKPLLDYHAATNPRFHDRVPSGPKARLVALLRWCLVNAYDDRNKDAYEKLVGYMSLASRKRAHSLILYSTYRWCDGQTYQIPTDGDWAAYDMGVNGPSSPRGLANETIGVPGVVPGGMVGPALLHSPAAVFAAVVAAAASARGHGMPDLIKGVFSDCGVLSAETNITSPEYWGASPTQVFTQTITFRLTSDQTDQLAPGNADPKKGVPGVYLFIGNFATINAGHFSTGKQIPVANPPQLSVMANSRNCLPLGHPATGLPIDLMPGLTKAPNCENRIDVAFMSSTSLVVAVVFARKHMPQSLVAKIRDTNRATTESVRQKFFGTSNSADDEDVIPEGALVSLKCPLGQCRIRTPARSTNCQHSQCFDCETFLQFYQNRQPWKCPVCSVSIQSWRELIVDGYFEEILQKTSEDDDQIYIEPNGDWKHKDNAAAGPLGSPAGKGRRRSVDAVDTVDLSDSSNLNNAARNKRQRTDYVDLTLDSDSDDAADAFDLPPLTQEEIDMINTLEAELTSESGSRSVTRSSSDPKEPIVLTIPPSAEQFIQYSSEFVSRGYAKSDIFLYPDFVSDSEHDLLVSCCNKKLRRLASTYQMGHFDKRIHNYRECSVSAWLPHSRGIAGRVAATMGRRADPDPIDLPDRPPTGKASGWTTVGKHDGEIRHILDRVWGLFPQGLLTWLPPHILDLHEDGEILPHVDNPDYSGFVVGGLCLLGPAVSTFKHVDNPSVRVDVLLPPKSLYFMTNRIRYQFTHEITTNPEQRVWTGRPVPQARRISLMFRDAKEPKEGWASLAGAA